ncbi:YitT family protein [Devosia sp. CN2-171]|uniref:YitT family protein n=1 Tax=Devosia sp. CN2-171 TaxID=3400909 RepID=UPI003BF8BBD1
MQEDLPTAARHTLYEDVFAILIGTSMVALGITLFSKATLITGSTAGIALLLQYATGVQFGILFFAINLPFYLLAALRMGWPFTIKTMASVVLVSAFSALFPQWLQISAIEPIFAAPIGGVLIGLGILSLFRHRASVGGVTILSLFLQDKFGIRAGYLQLGIDAVILAAAFFVVPVDRAILSLFGALVLNMIVGLNHKPGRYVGFS